MKKALALILACAMLLGAVSGCSGSTGTTGSTASSAASGAASSTSSSTWYGTPDGKPVTLQLWAGVQPEYGYDELVSSFNKEYESKGIQVEYVRYVNDTNGNLQLETYLMSGGDIDVFIGYGGVSKYNSRISSGLLLDVTDYLTKYNFDAVKELGSTSMTPYVNNGKVYGMPTKYENSRWMLINETMFKNAGVAIPYDGWTYDEYLEACKKLTTSSGQNKVYAMMWDANQSSPYCIACIDSVLGGNSTYANDLKSTTFTDKVWGAGLNLMKTTMDSGYAYALADEVADSLTVANTFLNGTCAMSLNISQMRMCMDTATYPHTFVTALVPFPVPSTEYMTDKYKTHSMSTGAGDVISIAANTKYADAAAEFMMWYITGGMAPLAAGGRIPLWNGFDSSAIVSVLEAHANGTIDMDSLRKYMSVDKTAAVNSLSTSNDTKITSILWEEMQSALYGKSTVDAALSSAKTRADQLLAG